MNISFKNYISSNPEYLILNYELILWESNPIKRLIYKIKGRFERIHPKELRPNKKEIWGKIKK